MVSKKKIGIGIGVLALLIIFIVAIQPGELKFGKGSIKDQQYAWWDSPTAYCGFADRFDNQTFSDLLWGNFGTSLIVSDYLDIRSDVLSSGKFNTANFTNITNHCLEFSLRNDAGFTNQVHAFTFTEGSANKLQYTASGFNKANWTMAVYDYSIAGYPINFLESNISADNNDWHKFTFCRNANGTHNNFTLYIDDIYYFNSTNATTLGTLYNITRTDVDAAHSDMFLNNMSIWGSPNITDNDCWNYLAFPEITYTSPTFPDDAQTTNLSFPINVTVDFFGINESNTTFALYDSIGTELSLTTYTNATRYVLLTVPSNGSYYYNVTAFNINGEGAIADTREINIGSFPPVINLNHPSNDYIYLYQYQNLTFNVSINSSVVLLGDCTYTYNGTETNMACNGLNFRNFTQDFQYEAGINNLTVRANGAGGVNTTEVHSWDVTVIEYSQTYNNQTTEGNLETFLANLSAPTAVSISSANLTYDSNATIGQNFLVDSRTILRVTDLLIKDVSANEDKIFYWELMLSNGTLLNLTAKNQTVLNLGLDNCSSFTNTLINATVYDEDDLSSLTNTIVEIAVNIYDKDRTAVVINTSILSHSNPAQICLSTALLNTSMYSMDSTIKYEAETHAIEYYNIQNLTLNANTSSQSIGLYDLNDSESTEFKLTFIGDDFLPTENALVFLDRQYVSENLFRTVEVPKTDSNGQTILHMVRNDIVYNIRIIKFGELIGNFENLRAFCDDFTIGDCTIDLSAISSTEEIFDYNEALGIIFVGPDWNETTRLVTFDFVTTDGTAKLVNMEIIRNDIFGNRTVCNTSLESSGGTLICPISADIEEASLGVRVLVDGIDAVYDIFSLDTSNYDEMGYIIYFIMLASFIFLFMQSKNMVLVGIIMGFVAGISFGLINSNLIGIGASGIWMLLIVLLGLWRLNRGREQ